MKNRILHIDSYIPTSNDTWLFEFGCIKHIEQIRVITIEDLEKNYYPSYIEYVHSDASGAREVWQGGDITPHDACDCWMFSGPTITKAIFDDLFWKQSDYETREEFHESLNYQIDTYWSNYLSIAPDVLAYCKEKDSSIE